LMRIYKTGQTVNGTHEPLVTTEVFEKVQATLEGKRVDRSASHLFTYSRIVRCGFCGYSVIAERRKGHVYYRCHNRPFKNPAICLPTSVREERLDEAVISRLAEVDLSDDELEFARLSVSKILEESQKNRNAAVHALRLQLQNVQARLAKLTDLLVDGTIDKSLFTRKQNADLLEQARINERLAETEAGSGAAVSHIEKTVELAKSPSLLYKTASPEKKRELLQTLLTNLTVSGKNVEMTL